MVREKKTAVPFWRYTGVNRIWPKLKKMLYPGLPYVILFAAVGCVSPFLTFSKGLEDTPFAYISYVLSAYALTIAVAEAVIAGKAIRRTLYETPVTNRYLTDAFFRVRAGLQLSLLVSLFYAGFILVSAVIYASFWEGALSFYYILLCGVRVNLTTALVSMFSLETAMVNRFGEDMRFQEQMTAATTFAVCALVLAIAVFMVIQSGKN